MKAGDALTCFSSAARGLSAMKILLPKKDLSVKPGCILPGTPAQSRPEAIRQADEKRMFKQLFSGAEEIQLTPFFLFTGNSGFFWITIYYYIAVKYHAVICKQRPTVPTQKQS